MPDRILFLVDNLDRARFFGRFADACRGNNTVFRFLTYRRSSYRYLLQCGFDSRLVPRRNNDGSTNFAEPCLEWQCQQALEVVSGDVPVSSAVRVGSQIARQISIEIQDFSPTHLFLWNGSQLVDRIANAISPRGIEKRFFEIANLPGKVFVDPCGVNAASSLFTSPESLLDCIVPSDEEFIAWRTVYHQAQISRGVPQAGVASSLQWERPLDALASRFGYGYYPIGFRTMLSKLAGKLANRSAVGELINDHRAPSDYSGEFRFFPLQVSGDTQLLINSDVGNLEALAQVFDECVADSIDLIVKLHPAENDFAALANLRLFLNQAKLQGSIYLSNQPTTALIRNAQQVYTINSTVGLETLIAGKPLKVLGRAFYQHFVDRHDLLKCYVLRYLLPIEYFSSEKIPTDLLRRILAKPTANVAHPPIEMALGK